MLPLTVKTFYIMRKDSVLLEKMKTEKLCKMLMPSLTIPLNGIIVTVFSMFENSVMILLGPGIAYS